MPDKNSINKKAVMIVAYENFRDEEYLTPKKILKERGVEVKTASNKIGKAKGTGGVEAEVDLLVKDIHPDDFDAVIFIGGQGALENLDNQISYNLARTAVEKRKILAAICVSPVILAKAGALKGRQATVWSSLVEQRPVKVLEANGAKYQNKAVVVDGKIITADGPAAAQEFGEKIRESLSTTYP